VANFTQGLFVDAATVTVGVGGPLNGALLELYQNDITPTPTTPIGDFTVADYDGYAAEALSWLAVSVNDAGQVEVQGIIGEFRPTGSTTPNTIYGWFLTESGGALIDSGRFEGAPISMADALNNILCTYIYRPQADSVNQVIT